MKSKQPSQAEPEEDVLDNEYESDYQSHYQTEDEDDNQMPDDITAKSGVSKLGMFFSQKVNRHQEEEDATTEVETKSRMSRKSLKSIVVNDKDQAKKRIIALDHEELMHLPNKAFYNGDGSKIQFLGTLGP